MKDIDFRVIEKKWLITGVAGFIGSHLLEYLLKNNQEVIGIDNFLTGKRDNLESVLSCLPICQRKNFSFYEGDISKEDDCLKVTKGIDIILHQAALGSVPRSIKVPQDTHKANVDGFFNILNAARLNNVKRFVYASSSSVYGDSLVLPKKEENIGNALSPYAATKYMNEVYARVFHKCYGIETIGLRYFNVFGPRQDPNGPYAAVMPKWIDALTSGKDVYINGDGETTRDFCYIQNVVDANINAALVDNPICFGKSYNIAFGEETSLNHLYENMQVLLGHKINPVFQNFREGDIRHSLADISSARKNLSYDPKYGLKDGLKKYIMWIKNELP